VTTYIPTEIPEKNQEQSVSGEIWGKKVKIESALSYKSSLKVKQNCNAAFAVYIKPAWLASILPQNLISYQGSSLLGQQLNTYIPTKSLQSPPYVAAEKLIQDMTKEYTWSQSRSKSPMLYKNNLNQKQGR